MKNKIFLIVPFWIMALVLGACSDYLDETPNKSGSAYIYHMDQLYGLTGSPDLYLFGSPGYIQYGITGSYWDEQLLLNDAVEYSPEYWFIGNGCSATAYNTYCYGTEKAESQYTMGLTWTPSWERIYRFNTVIENLDKVIQTTKNIRNQVEGEARFGRAYYHFILLTQYSLWKEDAPGIGYRDNTLPGDVPARQTVKYTLGRIYEDLQLAEDALREAGRTTFDFEHNFRPTVPTVQAFRARVDLYRGNYESALQNASAALAAHSVLVDFKNDPDYTLTPSSEIYLLDETDRHVASTITTQMMMTLVNRRAEMIPEYEELYLPGMSKGDSFGAPISESFYNLFDKDNDARWIYFYNAYGPLQSTSLLQPVVLEGETTPTPNCLKWSDQQWLKPENCHSYLRFYCNGGGDILGMTTAEMYLIKAECLARSGDTNGAAEVLKTLRRTRFMNDAAAENIGGSVQEVLDERTREMGAFWRFFDIKRLNGAENAGIYIRRDILTDPSDLNSVTRLEIGPEDPRWALMLYPLEVESMGWQQNEGWN